MMLETTTSGGERPLVAVNGGGADNEARASWLLCRTGGITCALPIENVSEIMRPLPIEQIAGAPEYILGLSVIRGAPVPVADLGAIVSGRKTRPARLIAARAATGKIALAVQAVTGVSHHRSRRMPRFAPAAARRRHRHDRRDRCGGQRADHVPANRPAASR